MDRGLAWVPLAELWRHTAEGARNGAARPPLEHAKAVVGQSLGPVRYVLDAEVVDAYTRFLGRPCLYPTVPARHTALLRDTEFAPGGAGINARTELELFRPPSPGDRITVTGTIADRYVRRGKPYLVIAAESRNQRGELLDRIRLTEMQRKEEVAGKWEFLREPAT